LSLITNTKHRTFRLLEFEEDDIKSQYRVQTLRRRISNLNIECGLYTDLRRVDAGFERFRGDDTQPGEDVIFNI
jgi:hypothetical protein